MKNKIAAVSIYVFNFLEIGEKLESLVNSGINWIHIDIMDGIFVNNYALCQKFCLDIRNKYPSIIIDVHLMCLDSYKYIDSFAKAGSTYFNFHFESLASKSENSILGVVSQIKQSKMKPILALNPETDIKHVSKYFKHFDGIMLMNILPGFNGQKIIPESYEKIKLLKKFRDENNLDFFIMTDGGAREDTYLEICNSGADVVVVGAFVNVENAKMKEQIDKIQSLN